MAVKQIKIPLWVYELIAEGNISQRASELITKGLLYEKQEVVEFQQLKIDANVNGNGGI